MLVADLSASNRIIANHWAKRMDDDRLDFRPASCEQACSSVNARSAPVRWGAGLPETKRRVDVSDGPRHDMDVSDGFQITK